MDIAQLDSRLRSLEKWRYELEKKTGTVPKGPWGWNLAKRVTDLEEKIQKLEEASRASARTAK
jgi:hypothetical protein